MAFFSFLSMKVLQIYTWKKYWKEIHQNVNSAYNPQIVNLHVFFPFKFFFLFPIFSTSVSDFYNQAKYTF